MELKLLAVVCCAVFVATVGVCGSTEEVRAESGDGDIWKCVELRDAVYHAIHDYVIPTLYGVDVTDTQQVAQVKQKIRDMIGVNVDSLQDIQKKTCQMVGIKTIGELSDVLHLDYQYVRELYEVSVAMVEAVPNGVDNYEQTWKITVLLADFFRNSEYPKWPLGVSMSDSFYLTWGLIREYGPEFLQAFQPWEQTHVDAYKFITALTDATSTKDFEDISELDGSMTRTIFSIADKTYGLNEEQYQQFLRSGNAYARFLRVCDQLGLLSLKAQRVAKQHGEAQRVAKQHEEAQQVAKQHGEAQQVAKQQEEAQQVAKQQEEEQE